MTSENNFLDKGMELEDSSPTGDMDDGGDDSLRAKNNDTVLAKASMTESYSEILNSPTAETCDPPIESNAPVVIPRRRPTSLNRLHSSQQCEYSLKAL